jgi:hypothetical protein
MCERARISLFIGLTFLYLFCTRLQQFERFWRFDRPSKSVSCTKYIGHRSSNPTLSASSNMLKINPRKNQLKNFVTAL